MKTNKTSHKKPPRGLARRIATILLAGAMVFPVALSASACRVTITDNGDGTFNIDPANPNEQDNNTGSQGSTNTPQDNQTTPKEPDYSKYSPLLQEVLNDSEYDELWRRYESGELKEYSGTFDSGVNLMEAIPYKFLASKGEDVEGIKGGTVAAGSDLYTIENEKNCIYDRLEIIYKSDNGEDYIHQYLLQYKITEQELKDLTMLYRGDYFQGPVMFQHLASKQTPKVIAEFAITEKGNKKIIANCNDKRTYLSEAINSDDIDYANIISMKPITLWNEPAYNIKFWLFSVGNNNPVSARTLYEVDIQTVVRSCKLTVNNNIYDLEDLFALNPILISSTPITYFHLSHSFRNFKDRL